MPKSVFLKSFTEFDEFWVSGVASAEGPVHLCRPSRLSHLALGTHQALGGGGDERGVGVPFQHLAERGPYRLERLRRRAALLVALGATGQRTADQGTGS